MDDVDWFTELENRDTEGLVDSELRDPLENRALDALAQIYVRWPKAYQIMPKKALSKRALISIVCETLFAILRNCTNEGHIREDDDVYGFTLAAELQSAVIEFRKSDIEILSSYGNGNRAYGSFFRGGI